MFAADVDRVLDRHLLVESPRAMQDRPQFLPVQVDDLDDVLVVEPAGELRLVQEQLDAARVRPELRQDLLEDDQPLERVGHRARKEQVRHSAPGQLANNLVRPEAGRYPLPLHWL